MRRALIAAPFSSFRDAPSWAQTRNPAQCTVLDSGFAPSGAPRNDGGCLPIACSISLLQYHAIVGREPRRHALARTVGVHVESRGIGHRGAQHGAGVEFYLV